MAAQIKRPPEERGCVFVSGEARSAEFLFTVSQFMDWDSVGTSLTTSCRTLMSEQYSPHLNVNVFFRMWEKRILHFIRAPLFCSELIFIGDIGLFVCLLFFFTSPELDGVRVTKTGTMLLCLKCIRWYEQERILGLSHSRLNLISKY